jgi:hypothetical protein
MLLAIAVFIDYDGCPSLYQNPDQYKPVIGAYSSKWLATASMIHQHCARSLR